ncbi:AAA family ATPase [Spirosoma lituiforme]
MLKRVSIQNFKSLKDVTLDLQKVNLLIGPNNSGKTNFLKALEFLNFQAYKGPIENLGRSIYSTKDGLPFFRLGLKFVVSEGKESYGFYTLEISGNYGEGYTEFWGFTNTDIEKAEVWDIEKLNTDFNSFELNVSDDSFSSFGAYGDYAEENSTLISNSALFHISKHKDDLKAITPVERGQLLHSFTRQLSFKKSWIKDNYYPFNDIKIYKPDPNKLDKPAPVGLGDDSVNADASNLIAFFDRIRDEYPESFAQIKADLSKCVPEFTEINFQNVPSTEELVKQFGDKTFKRIGLTNGKQKTIYWADELSEGTIYFVALLCIINQPNPPKLLLLEEPEKGIHPRRIFEVIQFIFRLAEEKDVQVIMTTYSPIVVDMFKDMPESVFIFDKDEEGATHVKNLQHDVIEPEIIKSKELGIEPPHYTDSLGDAWTVGFLGGVPK